jgi:hypothetical protein
VIAVLAGLLMPALSRAQARAHRMTCASNLRQFGLALHLYAGDQQDFLLPNMDGQDIPLGQTWVEGWLGLPGPDTTNTLYLQRSLVGSYLQEVRLWQCPSAEPVTLGTLTQPRVRTVSLEQFYGVADSESGGHQLPADQRYCASVAFGSVDVCAAVDLASTIRINRGLCG